MDRLSLYAEHAKQVLGKNWAQWLLATVAFFLISWFLIGSGVASCSTATPAFNSDTTGGTVWFQWVSGNDLDWDYTTQSNYPIGEQLNRPQGVTALAFSTLYKIIASFTTPICGMNIMIMLGYMSTALLMFGLVKWLFRSGGMAFLAGFITAFTPYIQLKSQSHIVYMYSSVFIAIIWAFLWFVSKPSYRRAIVLAAATVLGAYVDGYFVLFAGVLLASLIMFNLLRRTLIASHMKGSIKFTVSYGQLWRNIKSNFLLLTVVVVTMTALSLPIVFVLKNQGSEIRQSLSAARGNIYSESVTYGARFYDFVAPAYNNYFMPDGYEQWRIGQNHESNSSESTLYIASPVLVLAVASAAMVIKKKNRRLKLLPNLTYGYVVGLCVFAIAICLVFAIPSKVTLVGYTFKTPLWYFVGFFDNWRVFARFILVIQPLVTILAMCSLYLARHHIKRRYFSLVLVLIFTLTAASYLSSPVRISGDLYKDTAGVYEELKLDAGVQVIAEYPLTDLIYTPSIFTAQQYHGKPVYNANDSAIILSPLNRSIAGVGDIQSLGVLKARGVTHVISRIGKLPNIPGLNLYSEQDDKNIVAYTISDSVIPRFFALAPVANFDFAGLDKGEVSHYVVAGQGTLRVLDVGSQNRTPANGKVRASLVVRTLGDKPADVVITQSGAIVWSGSIGSEPTTIKFDAQKGDLTFTTTQPIDASNFSVIDN